MAPLISGGGGGSGFDRAEIQDASGLRQLSKAQYDALSLSERISLVLQKKVRFFRAGSEVSANEALRG